MGVSPIGNAHNVNKSMGNQSAVTVNVVMWQCYKDKTPSKHCFVKIGQLDYNLLYILLIFRISKSIRAIIVLNSVVTNMCMCAERKSSSI